MTIQVGDRLPDATFKVMSADGPAQVTTAELFAGKRVILFALPGAFTPTCHKNHLPGFLEHLPTFKAKGIDAIAVTSVNDVFVMGAWAEATGGKGKIDFLADGNADFAKSIGMEVDASAGGMGIRSQRYAMIVEDGVVKTLNIEEKRGQAVASGAAAMLELL